MDIQDPQYHPIRLTVSIPAWGIESMDLEERDPKYDDSGVSIPAWGIESMDLLCGLETKGSGDVSIPAWGIESMDETVAA